MKDSPADRRGPRERLKSALDEVFAEKLDPKHQLDALEGKLFGIGAESYTVGSHEFYLAYAAQHGQLVCLDTGHYHPTENVADKLSSVLTFLDQILLHVSRGVRWDSDHVVVLSDDLLAIAQELVRGGYLERTHIAGQAVGRGHAARDPERTRDGRSPLLGCAHACMKPCGRQPSIRGRS
jgi:L-rhamnose isomerase